MHALVLSLAKKGENTKIVKVEEFFDLKPGHVAVRLDRKSCLKFKKGVEYGRQKVIDGELMMVRHRIFEVNGESHSCISNIRVVKVAQYAC